MPDYKKLSDLELAELLKASDKQAFTEIYDRYWSVMYAHVYKMLRDREDARDIVQEIFSNLWIKSADIKSDANVAGLLYRTARNRVLDLIKHERVKSDYLGSFTELMNTVDPQIVNHVDEKMLLAVIEEEIQKLPEKMKVVFEMSRKENLSHKEIAHALNISDQTVKKQIQNALKLIKPRLNELGISISILILFR